MMCIRSTKFSLIGFGQVASDTWDRMARKFPNARYTEHQIIVHQPKGPEPAVRAWVAHPVMPARKVLAETVRVLPAKDIHELIDELIEELDNRSGDPDVEAEPTEDDDESEVELVDDDDEAEPEPAEEDDVLEQH